MPWFRVDDSLDQHPKADLAGNRALGLWVRAGAYCARLLTEGYVPLAQVAKLGGSRRDAEALVMAGLWVRAEGGYQFHQWADRQPSRAQVEADRAAAAERQRRARDRARNGLSPRESRRDTDEPSRRDSHRESRSPRPGPAQTPKHLLTLISRLAAGDGPPPANVIDAWQDLAGPDVDLEAEAAAYLVRHGDRPARDPRGAWLGWLTKARDRAAATRPAPPKPPCAEQLCVNGWLGGDGDNDTPVPCPKCKPHLRIAHPEAS